MKAMNIFLTIMVIVSPFIYLYFDFKESLWGRIASLIAMTLQE